ncbi:hypothetical protein OOK50_33120 [Streptomyces sp. NBC_01789]|nr:hypothetical protein [Streptomyces sp. NBC_01789]
MTAETGDCDQEHRFWRWQARRDRPSMHVKGALISGTALVVIEVARSVPAWLRVKRTRSGHGISPVSMGVLAGTGPGWIAVAVLAQSVAAAVAGVVWPVFHGLLWREVAKAEPAMNKTIVSATLFSFAAIGLVTIVGLGTGYMEPALGSALVIASACYSLPALYRGMKSPTTTGLSLVSLAVNSVEGAIYFVGGVGMGGITPYGHPVLAYIFFGGLALVSNLPRLARAGARRAMNRDG